MVKRGCAAHNLGTPEALEKAQLCTVRVAGGTVVTIAWDMLRHFYIRRCLMRWNPPFPGDKIPPSIWVLVGVSEWLETHPDDVPDLGAKRFGLNGLWGAFDHLHSQDPSAERIRCQRHSTPILPQLECVLVVASPPFFWIFTPKIRGRWFPICSQRTFFKTGGKKKPPDRCLGTNLGSTLPQHPRSTAAIWCRVQRRS